MFVQQYTIYSTKLHENRLRGGPDNIYSLPKVAWLKKLEIVAFVNPDTVSNHMFLVELQVMNCLVNVYSHSNKLEDKTHSFLIVPCFPLTTVGIGAKQANMEKHGGKVDSCEPGYDPSQLRPTHLPQIHTHTYIKHSNDLSKPKVSAAGYFSVPWPIYSDKW